MRVCPPWPCRSHSPPTFTLTTSAVKSVTVLAWLSKREEPDRINIHRNPQFFKPGNPLGIKPARDHDLDSRGSTRAPAPSTRPGMSQYSHVIQPVADIENQPRIHPQVQERGRPRRTRHVPYTPPVSRRTPNSLSNRFLGLPLVQ